MMKHNKFWLFLSLIPFLAGCGNKNLITHTKEELIDAVKALDYSVTYSKVDFNTTGHVCGIEGLTMEEFNKEVPLAAEKTYYYDTTLTEEDKIAEDKWYKDKKRKEFIEKRTFKLKEEKNGGAQNTTSCYLRVPMRIYQNDNAEDKYHDLFEKFQYQAFLDKVVQDEHNGGKVFDVMQSEITSDGIRFFCENNYKVTTIYGIDVNLGDILARGRFNISYTYDKNGYLTSESIQTIDLNQPKERVIDFTVNYTYEV